MSQDNMFTNSRYELVERPAVAGEVLVEAFGGSVLLVQKPKGGFEVHYGLSCKLVRSLDDAWTEFRDCAEHDLMANKHKASRRAK